MEATTTEWPRCAQTPQQNVKNVSTNLKVDINNFTFTPLSCAMVVSEVIKCLIYQKSQIPYSYSWLKHIITKKRKNNPEEQIQNVLSAKQFHIASSAFDTIEEFIKNLVNQFQCYNNIREVMIIFGATPLNPKETYRFNIPVLPLGHIESNHHESRVKNQPKILRSILFSHEWISAMDHQLPLTNMYLFVRLQRNGSSVDDSLDYFSQNSTVSNPNKSFTRTFTFLYKEPLENCCNNLTIYEDKHSSINKSKLHEEDTSEEDEANLEWFQANCILKGFKENYVKKIPVSEMW